MLWYLREDKNDNNIIKILKKNTMEFTFDISWPAFCLIMVAIGMLIDTKEKKAEKINKIESDNIIKNFDEYHTFFKDFMKKNIESNRKLSEENKNLKQRIHKMETRSMTKSFGNSGN